MHHRSHLLTPTTRWGSRGYSLLHCGARRGPFGERAFCHCHALPDSERELGHFLTRPTHRGASPVRACVGLLVRVVQRDTSVSSSVGVCVHPFLRSPPFGREGHSRERVPLCLLPLCTLRTQRASPSLRVARAPSGALPTARTLAGTNDRRRTPLRSGTQGPWSSVHRIRLLLLLLGTNTHTASGEATGAPPPTGGGHKPRRDDRTKTSGHSHRPQGEGLVWAGR